MIDWFFMQNVVLIEINRIIFNEYCQNKIETLFTNNILQYLLTNWIINQHNNT